MPIQYNNGTDIFWIILIVGVLWFGLVCVMGTKR